MVKDLKIETGAKATSIYGSRAAYGVVTIQLKEKLKRKEYRRILKYLDKF